MRPVGGGRAVEGEDGDQKCASTAVTADANVDVDGKRV